MTDQTGADQKSASGSQTGDVDVADPSRPDTTTDVQTGGTTDVGAGGPEAVTAGDDAAIRGGEDVDAPGGERDVTDRERDTAGRERDDRRHERGETSRDVRDSDESARESDESATDSDEERQPSMRSARRRPRSSPVSTTRSSTTSRPVRSSGRRATGPRTTPAAPGVGQRRQPRRGLRSRLRLRLDSTDRVRVESDSAQTSGTTGSQEDRPTASADDGRRTSSLDEIRDGGYGVGSAATIDDGAVPLGHPVKAWEDTKTYVTPDHAKYGEAEPHPGSPTPTRPSELPTRRLTPAPTAQVGTGSESADAPDARSSAWWVGPSPCPRSGSRAYRGCARSAGRTPPTSRPMREPAANRWATGRARRRSARPSQGWVPRGRPR